jgi:uncharacterized protein GlcG (DUF336 family)
MKLAILFSIVALIAATYSVRAQNSDAKSPGFPGDLGRPFNGLPMPDNPAVRRPPWPTRPQPARTPSLEVALQMVQEAAAACKGYHVGISVIDSAGTPKLYYVPDGTAGFHAYTGFRKAYTALTFKMPTSEVGMLSKTDPTVATKITADTNLLAFAGGVPIVVDGQVIGAIGVSGAEPSAVDEKCANAGLDKVKSLLT